MLNSIPTKADEFDITDIKYKTATHVTRFAPSFNGKPVDQRTIFNFAYSGKAQTTVSIPVSAKISYAGLYSSSQDCVYYIIKQTLQSNNQYYHCQDKENVWKSFEQNESFDCYTFGPFMSGISIINDIISQKVEIINPKQEYYDNDDYFIYSPTKIEDKGTKIEVYKYLPKDNGDIETTFSIDKNSYSGLGGITKLHSGDTKLSLNNTPNELSVNSEINGSQINWNFSSKKFNWKEQLNMKRDNEYYHFMPSLQQRTECNLDQIAIYKISNSTNTQLIHRTRTKLASSLYYLAIWKHNNPNLGNVYPQLRDQIIEEIEWNIIELPRVPQYHISWLKDIDGRNANQNVKNTFESIISEKINQLSGDSIGCIDTYEIYSYLELRDSRAALKNSWIGLQFKKLEQVLVESTDQIRNSIGAGYYDNISFTMTDGVYGINCRFYVTVPETGKARVEMKVEYV